MRSKEHETIVELPVATLPHQQRIGREEGDELALGDVASREHTIAMHPARPHLAPSDALVEISDPRAHQVAARLRLFDLAC